MTFKYLVDLLLKHGFIADQKDLALLLGISQQAVSQRAKKGTVPRTWWPKLNKIEGLPSILKEADFSAEENVSVRYFPDIYASAGSGVINYAEKPEVMKIEARFLSSELGAISRKNLLIIHAVGDSMSPTIKPGDLLFTDPGEQVVRTGAVYVLGIEDQIYVKRVEKNPLSEEMILRSDNSDYEAITVSKEDTKRVRIIGRVIGNYKKI